MHRLIYFHRVFLKRVSTSSVKINPLICLNLEVPSSPPSYTSIFYYHQTCCSISESKLCHFLTIEASNIEGSSASPEKQKHHFMHQLYNVTCSEASSKQHPALHKFCSDYNQIYHKLSLSKYILQQWRKQCVKQCSHGAASCTETQVWRGFSLLAGFDLIAQNSQQKSEWDHCWSCCGASFSDSV